MTETKCRVPVLIKKANLVLGWDFIGDPKDETIINKCKLCKRELVAPPLHELQTNDNECIKIEGKLVKGRCGDIFHEKCIANLLSSGCVSCPTCNVPWQQAKILRSSIVTGNIENLTVKKKTISTQ